MAELSDRHPDPGPTTDDIEARRKALGQAVGQASSVPLATFGTCDPMVEAKLLDDVVLQVFLQHMNLVDAEPRIDPPSATAASDEVTEADLRSLFQAMRAPRGPVPDPLDGLLSERLWILVDIARSGTGLARQRATAELRSAMQDLCRWEGLDEAALTQLADLLQRACAEDDAPVLFRTLELAARRALRDKRDGAPR